ncbi:MAG: sensor histidine kinase [Burkholderiales bacterium]
MNISDEASQAVSYLHRLEQKSRELEAANASLRAANERLQEIDRIRDDFLATVTHELRAPLTAIRAMSEILLDDPAIPSDERKRFLSIIVKESERLTRLVNRTLDLARIESGITEWQPAELDMRELIRESAEAIMAVYREQQVQFELELPENIPPVMADRDRLIQVMVNLLSNAVKFCDRTAGHVIVRLSREAGHVRVDVRDNGRGIALADRQRIFEKFTQVSNPPAGNASAGKQQGSGLGLPISRKIIEHFGGALWVEGGDGSEAGKGATFSFTLPLNSGMIKHK